MSSELGVDDAEGLAFGSVEVRDQNAAPARRALIGSMLMLGSAATWAMGMIASKAVLDATKASSLTLLTVQLAASVAALGIVVAARRLPLSGAWRAGWPGLLEPGLAYQLSLAGLAVTSASNATVLASLEPVVIPVIGFAIFRSRPGLAQIPMIIAATIGAVLVSWDGSATGSRLAGDLLVFASVVAAAMYVVISHRHVDSHEPVALAFVQQAWAMGLTCAIVAVAMLVGDPPWPATAGGILAAAGSGLCNYAVPFVLYLTALRHLSLSSAASYLCLIPVFGLVGAVVLLGETVTALQIGGSAIVVVALLAIAMANRLTDR
jgi:drug/metabolite transporter (DMT)-like permease